MTNSVVQYTEGPPRQMGKVKTTLIATNRADQILAQHGVIPNEEIRSVFLTDVLVDTRATLLGLPADIVATLGLTLRREAEVHTANGPATMRIFTDLQISVEGRETLTKCLELPVGTPALLGVIPLEDLGLEPDLKNERLRLLPMEGDDTYLTAYSIG